MDKLLGHLHLDPLPPGKGNSEDILVLETMALDWENMAFTQDFLHKLVTTKENLTKELVEGRLDKGGLDNSDAKRAVITYANAILTYVPAIKAQANQVRQAKELMERKQGRFAGGIHGGEHIVY